MHSFLNKKLTIQFFVISFIFILDRVTKEYVISFYEKNYDSDIFNSKFLNITLVWNEGIAFGLFSFDEKSFYHFLTFIIGVVIIVILFMIKQNKGLKKYSLSMILGGALGNFYDRITYNAVPDFIDFHIGNFHWFIFNVSDIFITIGILGMILLELTTNNKKV